MKDVPPALLWVVGLLALMQIGTITALAIRSVRARAASIAEGVQRALQERHYEQLLAECLDRQTHHEREHFEAHPRGGKFTDALRVENLANRFERRIHEAKLPPLTALERRRRAREALCRSR